MGIPILPAKMLQRRPGPCRIAAHRRRTTDQCVVAKPRAIGPGAELAFPVSVGVIQGNTMEKRAKGYRELSFKAGEFEPLRRMLPEASVKMLAAPACSGTSLAHPSW